MYFHSVYPVSCKILIHSVVILPYNDRRFEKQCKIWQKFTSTKIRCYSWSVSIHKQSWIWFLLHTCFDVSMCVPVLDSVSLWRSFGARVKNNTLIRSKFHACQFSLLVDRKAKADFSGEPQRFALVESRANKTKQRS